MILLSYILTTFGILLLWSSVIWIVRQVYIDDKRQTLAIQLNKEFDEMTRLDRLHYIYLYEFDEITFKEDLSNGK